jgi:sulfide:quinone oxidoreductase
MEHPRRVVVAGAGVAGLEALLGLRELAGARVDLTLVEPEPDFALHAVGVTEPFGAGRVGRLPIAELAARTGARLVGDPVRAVERDAGVVRTATGERLPYDALLVAVGAEPVVALRNAITWWPGGDRSAFVRLLDDAEAGTVRRIAFVVPSRCAWELPAYELALMTARRLARSGRAAAELALVTPERAPLSAFGSSASAAVAAELADVGVAFHGEAIASVRAGERLTIGGWPAVLELEVDAVVALPRAYGRPLDGLRADIEGFLVIDEHCRVRAAPGVWAAGDATVLLPKQGGLAALQATAAAEDIAARAGAPVAARPYRPVLRAQLRTGRGALWLERDLTDPSDQGRAARRPLWSPPGKIAAPRLGAVLAERDRPGAVSRA